MLLAHDYMAAAPWQPRTRDIPASLQIAQAIFKKEQRHIKEHGLRGNDIDDSVMFLFAMNLYMQVVNYGD